MYCLQVHCYIAICMKRHEEVPEWEEIAAVACAVQNMALVGSSMGVHGYWSSWQPAARDAPEMYALLKIDAGSGDRCLGVFVVGRAQQERLQGYRPRRQELSEKVLWLQ
jgi:nitroreductase